MARRRKFKSPNGFSVRYEAVTTRHLSTISPTNTLWSNESSLLTVGSNGKVIGSNSLVRVQPPFDATDAKIQWIKQRLANLGVCGFAVEPRAAAPGVVSRETEEDGTPGFREQYEVKSARSVVEQMIDEAFTEDRDLLRECVEKMLSEAECT